MFDLVSHLGERGIKLRFLNSEDSCGDDVTGNTAGTSEISLLGNINVGDVLYKNNKLDL